MAKISDLNFALEGASMLLNPKISNAGNGLRLIMEKWPISFDFHVILDWGMNIFFL